jgi:nitroreductase
MELYEVMRTTFAAREFTDDPVLDEVLYDVFENARFAPSGGNRQGNRVIVVRDDATREAFSKLAEPVAKRYAAQRAAGESPWNSVFPTSVDDATIAATAAPAALTDSYRSARVVLVFIVDLKLVASMDQYLDRVGVISGASIYPFVWNVLLGLRQAGFGGTITTLPVAREADIQALLHIPPHFAVAALVPVGKPVKQLTKLTRRSVEEIAVHERFDGTPFSKP